MSISLNKLLLSVLIASIIIIPLISFITSAFNICLTQNSFTYLAVLIFDSNLKDPELMSTTLKASNLSR